MWGMKQVQIASSSVNCYKIGISRTNQPTSSGNNNSQTRNSTKQMKKSWKIRIMQRQRFLKSLLCFYKQGLEELEDVLKGFTFCMHTHSRNDGKNGQMVQISNNELCWPLFVSLLRSDPCDGVEKSINWRTMDGWWWIPIALEGNSQPFISTDPKFVHQSKRFFSLLGWKIACGKRSINYLLPFNFSLRMASMMFREKWKRTQGDNLGARKKVEKWHQQL